MRNNRILHNVYYKCTGFKICTNYPCNNFTNSNPYISILNRKKGKSILSSLSIRSNISPTTYD